MVLLMDKRAGPKTTTIKAGKIHRIIGIVSFTGILAAAS
jgi:hypothetical protein